MGNPKFTRGNIYFSLLRPGTVHNLFTIKVLTNGIKCVIIYTERKKGSHQVKNYLYEITDEESEMCGQRVFVQSVHRLHAEVVMDNEFPETEREFLGVFSNDEAEALGYDTL